MILNCQLEAEDNNKMDQVELESEKNEDDDGDELEKSDGPALTKRVDRIEIPAVLQPAAEAETKENLGVAQKKVAIKKAAAKQSKAKASLLSTLPSTSGC